MRLTFKNNFFERRKEKKGEAAFEIIQRILLLRQLIRDNFHEFTSLNNHYYISSPVFPIPNQSIYPIKDDGHLQVEPTSEHFAVRFGNQTGLAQRNQAMPPQNPRQTSQQIQPRAQISPRQSGQEAEQSPEGDRKDQLGASPRECAQSAGASS